MRWPALLCGYLLAGVCHADIAVVAGKASPIDKLDAREVADIFLAKTSYFRDGSHVTPIELRENPFRASFYRNISGKTLPQINSYWTTLIFTGKGKPPRNVEVLERLVEQLETNPDTITYLPLEQVSGTLKVLYILR
jgi:hypothetical protein